MPLSDSTDTPAIEQGALPRVYAYTENGKNIVISIYRDRVKRFTEYLTKEEAASLAKDLKTLLKHPAFYD